MVASAPITRTTRSWYAPCASAAAVQEMSHFEYEAEILQRLPVPLRKEVVLYIHRCGTADPAVCGPKGNVGRRLCMRGNALIAASQGSRVNGRKMGIRQA